MSVLVFAELAAQQLRGAIGDHLVGVHVEADARARLKHVDHEVRGPTCPPGPLSRLAMMALAVFRVHQAEFAIGLGRRLLHHGDGANQRGMGVQSADGKVLDRAGGLNAVVNVGGNFFECRESLFRCGCAT